MEKVRRDVLELGDVEEDGDHAVDVLLGPVAERLAAVLGDRVEERRPTGVRIGTSAQ